MNIGIPPLLNAAANAANVAALLVADAQLFLESFISPRPLDKPTKIAENNTAVWGVFTQTGGLALSPDSIIAVDAKKDWNVSKYPMELGAFQSYNKVKEPFDIRVRMVIGGSTSRHFDFLDGLDTLVSGTDLVDIITPDAQYDNANAIGYDLHRTAQSGIGLLTVDVHFVEIRNTIVPTFGPVKSADAAKPAPAQVQPEVTDAQRTAAFNAKFNAAHPSFKPLVAK